MITFLTNNWDKILTGVIAIYAAILSSYTFFGDRKRSKKQEYQTKQYIISDVVSETNELYHEVSFLDKWIWEKREFKKDKEIVSALQKIQYYWRKNKDYLKMLIGSDSRYYQAIQGLNEVALQNLNREIESGRTYEWIGITQTNLLGHTVEQIFSNILEVVRKQED